MVWISVRGNIETTLIKFLKYSTNQMIRPVLCCFLKKILLLVAKENKLLKPAQNVNKVVRKIIFSSVVLMIYLYHFFSATRASPTRGSLPKFLHTHICILRNFGREPPLKVLKRVVEPDVYLI